MLSELSRQLKTMTQRGDTLICAVSGGADSVALLFGAYLLKEKLGYCLEAAHFNHGLRGAESDGDEGFVRQLCSRYEIPLHVGRGTVIPGKKGLEAAAREARYAFFATLKGKIATAHTADDNAETVLMHLVRGTGLKGLGGITPVRGKLIRPMLNVTRRQVLEFLSEYNVGYRTDSSNHSDDFLRNRIRHHVMPLLQAENPRLAENLSAMAARLRLDQEALAQAAAYDELPDVQTLRGLPPAVRSRMLERFLKENGVREPEAEHIALAEQLVFSDKPSAKGNFPGGVTLGRSYDRLTAVEAPGTWGPVFLPAEGALDLPDLGLRVICSPAQTIENTPAVFTVSPVGAVILRPRQGGDEMRLPGGTKAVKKILVDRKIPAHQRSVLPVLADEQGLLGVYSIGVNLDRAAKELPGLQIRFEKR